MHRARPLETTLRRFIQKFKGIPEILKRHRVYFIAGLYITVVRNICIYTERLFSSACSEVPLDTRNTKSFSEEAISGERRDVDKSLSANSFRSYFFDTLSAIIYISLYIWRLWNNLRIFL